MTGNDNKVTIVKRIGKLHYHEIGNDVSHSTYCTCNKNQNASSVKIKEASRRIVRLP